MMLCIKDGYWYIAQRIRADSPGCAIDVGPMMPHGEGFKALPPVGAVLYRSLPSLDGIRFFPLLRYRGYEVWPMRWHPESSEPLLFCRIDDGKVGGQSEAEFMQRVRELQADGWTWEFREGCEKYVHVDDLEKIEGPPPEGAF